MTTNIPNGQHEVLSPWAEADPIPSRGLISARVTDLAGRRIGLLCNAKRAARPILTVIDSKLRERFTTSEISWYFTRNAVGPPEIETEGKAAFEEWIKRVDTVVAAVGD